MDFPPDKLPLDSQFLTAKNAWLQWKSKYPDVLPPIDPVAVYNEGTRCYVGVLENGSSVPAGYRTAPFPMFAHYLETSIMIQSANSDQVLFFAEWSFKRLYFLYQHIKKRIEEDRIFSPFSMNIPQAPYLLLRSGRPVDIYSEEDIDLIEEGRVLRSAEGTPYCNYDRAYSIRAPYFKKALYEHIKNHIQENGEMPEDISAEEYEDYDPAGYALLFKEEEEEANDSDTIDIADMNQNIAGTTYKNHLYKPLLLSDLVNNLSSRSDDYILCFRAQLSCVAPNAEDTLSLIKAAMVDGLPEHGRLCFAYAKQSQYKNATFSGLFSENLTLLYHAAISNRSIEWCILLKEESERFGLPASILKPAILSALEDLQDADNIFLSDLLERLPFLANSQEASTLVQKFWDKNHPHLLSLLIKSGAPFPALSMITDLEDKKKLSARSPFWYEVFSQDALYHEALLDDDAVSFASLLPQKPTISLALTCIRYCAPKCLEELLNRLQETEDYSDQMFNLGAHAHSIEHTLLNHLETQQRLPDFSPRVPLQNLVGLIKALYQHDIVLPYLLSRALFYGCPELGRALFEQAPDIAKILAILPIPLAFDDFTGDQNENPEAASEPTLLAWALNEKNLDKLPELVRYGEHTLPGLAFLRQIEREYNSAEKEQIFAQYLFYLSDQTLETGEHPDRKLLSRIASHSNPQILAAALSNSPGEHAPWLASFFNPQGTRYLTRWQRMRKALPHASCCSGTSVEVVEDTVPLTFR